MQTERTRRLPRFSTHPIGSLPRPQSVRDLLARRGELPANRFGGLLDDMVRDAGDPPTIDEASEKLKRLVAATHRLRKRGTTNPVNSIAPIAHESAQAGDLKVPGS